tara:strand:- start:1264 stop:2937 length:1674 start_codon:yes stop_codon:yes gene_type:complete
VKITRSQLKSLIRKNISESRYYGMSLNTVLSFLESFSDNTWIFFDTETTGFDSHSRQLTEIAGVACNPNNWESDPQILGTFNEKIKLDDDTLSRIENENRPEEVEARAPNAKSVQDILSMTAYGEKNRNYLDEQEALTGFLQFIDSFPSPVLVAQNASFDMKFVSVRSGGRLKRYPVIDTMKIMQLFLIPLLTTLKKEHGDTEAAEFLQKLKRGRYYSSSMGVVSSAYGISIDNWHSAIADVEMLMEMLRHVVGTLRENSDIDISAEHERTASYHMKRSKRKKVKESSTLISKKSLTEMIRSSLIREGDFSDWFTGGESSNRLGSMNLDSEGCPIVNDWRDVYPALVTTDIISQGDTILVLDGSNQTLRLLTGGNLVKSFVCSTAARGFGNESGSEETSTGLMTVRGKVGAGQPKYMVFKGLAPTGHILGPNEGEKAWVLTRALTLTGLQRDNRNVSARAIYIHGTNRERVLGVPASGGCIRLSNNDILWAFDNISIGTPLYILGSPATTTPRFPCAESDIYENEERDKDSLLEIDELEVQDVVYGEPKDIEPDPTA